jgi:ATP-dependent helicase/nuclease subunit A
VSVLKDEQARLRIATDLDSNLGIEAAAGTGKTTVLVDRVVNLLASGRVTAEELVVITFTEKAAAELSARVREALERRAASAEPEERDLLIRAARQLYRARIETIHGFAASLLRERPVEAEIDPLFEVLDDLTSRLHFDRAYERFQDALLSDPRPELELALRRGFSITELREACETLSEHRHLLPLSPHPCEPLSIEQAVAEFGAIAGELRAMLVEYEPGEDKAVPFVEGVIEWVAELEGLGTREQERFLLHRPAAKTNLNAGTASNWGGDKDRMKDLQRVYRELCKSTPAQLRTEALVGLLPHVERFVSEYEMQRKTEGVADYDDLLFWSRDLLRDSPAARRYFRGCLATLLIDEFQDTDPVQAELALLLSADGEADGDWLALRPEAGRLTVVGDPKQSIYRFRRADIRLYERFMKGPLATGQERIATSFRANPTLLEAINPAFNEILKPVEEVQPANVPLDPAPDAAPAIRAPVVIAEGAVSGKADEIRREEARVLAGLLWRAHDEGWRIRDRREGNRPRECRWGDMAVLVPARTGLEHYERALAAAGIPYRHEGSRDFFERPEVRDLIWVLAAIDDPTDRLALVGALKSSAFAVSDEQLVIHRAGAGSLSYRHRPGTGSPIVEEALTELEDLHRLRRELSLAELVRRLVDRTRLVEFALTTPGGEQAAANLLAIVEDARLFAAAGGGGLRPFIRYLRGAMEEEAIEIEATVAEETDDVVRIMTMHGAKGLEYPIVALASIGGDERNQATPVPDERERRLHFRVGAESGGRHHFKTPGYDEVWEDEKELVRAERRRLLYVACTRARDHLLVPCVMGCENAKNLLADLVSNLPADERLVEVVDAAQLDPPKVEATDAKDASEAEITRNVAERTAWAQARSELRREGARERKIEHATSRERARGPLAAEVSTFDAGLMLDEGPPIPVGDAVHMVMERITLPDAGDLEEVAEDVCLEGDIAACLEEVLQMCRSCLQSQSVQAALGASRRWREVPFLVSRAGEGEDPEAGPLASGRVDLIYEDGGELVVVDYKTDHGVSAETAEAHTYKHHGGQAEVYAEALSSATGLPVREVVFVYARIGAEVKVRASDS